MEKAIESAKKENPVLTVAEALWGRPIMEGEGEEARGKLKDLFKSICIGGMFNNPSDLDEGEFNIQLEEVCLRICLLTKPSLELLQNLSKSSKTMMELVSTGFCGVSVPELVSHCSSAYHLVTVGVYKDKSEYNTVVALTPIGALVLELYTLVYGE